MVPVTPSAMLPVSFSPRGGELSPWSQVQHLGQTTRIDPQTGHVLLNYPLIESLVKQREKVITPLYTLLSQSTNLLQVAEGLYLAQRLAEENIPSARQLYGAASRFNETTHPLVQVYLAGFYRKLNVPEAFGPMVTMMIRHAQHPQTYQYPYPLNPMEEVGGTVLQLIANYAAQQVKLQLTQPR